MISVRKIYSLCLNAFIEEAPPPKKKDCPVFWFTESTYTRRVCGMLQNHVGLLDMLVVMVMIVTTITARNPEGLIFLGPKSYASDDRV